MLAYSESSDCFSTGLGAPGNQRQQLALIIYIESSGYMNAPYCDETHLLVKPADTVPMLIEQGVRQTHARSEEATQQITPLP